jgi:hypothetical protein
MADNLDRKEQSDAGADGITAAGSHVPMCFVIDEEADRRAAACGLGRVREVGGRGRDVWESFCHREKWPFHIGYAVTRCCRLNCAKPVN